MGSILSVDFFLLPFQIHKVYSLEEGSELGVEEVALDLISFRGVDGIVSKQRMILILHFVLYTYFLKNVKINQLPKNNGIKNNKAS